MGQTGPQVLREGKKFSVEFFRLDKTILPFPQLAQHDLRHPLGQSRGQRILSVTLFEKMPVLQALQPSDSQNESPYDPNQLILNGVST